MKRVLIVDDHELVRDGLRGALEAAGYDVAGEAEDGLQAVELGMRLRPDVVLLDVSMPLLDGIEAARRLRGQVPEARVVVLTMHAEPRLVSEAVAAGVAGYLLKDSPLSAVIDAVDRVAGGGTVISPQLPRDVSGLGHATDARAGLSSRETEILQLLADGYSPAEVARDLVISPNTVRNHLSSIYTKLDVGDRTQAVIEGLRRGVVSLRRPAEA